MQYDGPWRDSIVAYDMRDNGALYQFVVAACSTAMREEDRLGALPRLTERHAGPSESRRGVVGVFVEQRIEAIAIYCFSPCRVSDGGRPAVMQLTIGVARPYRGQGMGSALMAHCTSIARAAGAKHIIFDDIARSAHTSTLARRFGADLIVVNGDCQAWIDLRVPAIAATEPSLANRVD